MAWFDDDNIYYNERNISSPSADGDFDHHRPDHIVKRSNGEMIIVDYKFGFSNNPKTLAKHTSQVQEYLRLMRQLGETNVKGYVWYTRSGKIVEVEP
jgi:CRISPR/Cas system-associated exonuclease Cas4 (RecB family)